MTKETVLPETIGSAPMEKISSNGPIGSDPFSGDPVLAQHLGKLGAYVGGGPEKAGNIAYIVIICSVVLLVGSAAAAVFVQNSEISSFFDKLVTGCFSLISGALGFLFGKSGKD